MTERWTRRFVVLTALAATVLLVCPVAVFLFERAVNADLDSLGSAYVWLGRTLIEGVDAYNLKTAGGRITYYVVRLAGTSVVAFATGAISSRLVAVVVNKGKGMGPTRASGHIVICGWSGKGAEILRELRAKGVEDTRHIVVIAPLATDPTKGTAEFIAGDPTDAADLMRAGIDRADTAILLADESTQSSDADRDARTLLTCLAIESVNRPCYTCVEVVRSENRQHFARTEANELVVSAELTGALLASSARSHGMSSIVTDLLTHPEGAELYAVDIPAELAGVRIRDAVAEVKVRLDAMLVGFAPPAGSFALNPAADDVLPDGGRLLLVAARSPG